MNTSCTCRSGTSHMRADRDQFQLGRSPPFWVRAVSMICFILYGQNVCIETYQRAIIDLSKHCISGIAEGREMNCQSFTRSTTHIGRASRQSSSAIFLYCHSNHMDARNMAKINSINSFKERLGIKRSGLPAASAQTSYVPHQAF